MKLQTAVESRRMWNRPLVFLLIGFSVGALSMRIFDLSGSPHIITYADEIQVHDEKYPHINPLIAVESPESDKDMRAELEEVIRSHIRDVRQSKNIDNVSVYFRNLRAGRWFGIDEDAPFNPASLVKVPIMMAYFKMAENNPAILEQKYSYSDEDLRQILLLQDIDDKTILEKNVQYSVNELIREMIVRSDNIARHLLLYHGPGNMFEEIYKELGIRSRRGDYLISVRTYSRFFRSLYNATYLNNAYSEKALQLLLEADYHAGLRAGVPQNVSVAQKFGSSLDVRDGQITGGEIHDCGIVYYTLENPYLLCVMTHGSVGSNDLESLVADISRITYDFVKDNSAIFDIVNDSALNLPYSLLK